MSVAQPGHPRRSCPATREEQRGQQPHRVVAVVQARMGSQRLPGKVLLPLRSVAGGADHKVLDWVVHRVRRASVVDAVVVATSVDEIDDPLVAHCISQGYQVHRGSLNDVLARVYDAAQQHSADVVVRITADCPLIDPGVIDEVVTEHLERGNDFTANRLPPPATRSFPLGLDVEVADMRVLRLANDEAIKAPHREHVMPFIYEHPERFHIQIIESPEDAGDVRWTVDAAEDLQAVQGLVDRAEATTATSWSHLLRTWRAFPELAQINASVGQRGAASVDPRRDR